ncbi:MULTISPECIES: hypothetical protein [Actinomadura]|uniref:Uncharacterized protein n=1 Tax=Actinomadura litoris TaxID=2678616 RepID=A0A7K1L325_9ACTN|nr:MULTISPECIES: hypothetical protein [Actinomadura]MBT2213385.1 hypothetical protein [Actinomadura sp. NEAU-AAG7]MUN38821.1 hypothetical protein [Actinomadura litoris]
MADKAGLCRGFKIMLGAVLAGVAATALVALVPRGGRHRRGSRRRTAPGPAPVPALAR